MKKKLLFILLGLFLIFQVEAFSRRERSLEGLMKRVQESISRAVNRLTHLERREVHFHLREILYIIDGDYHDEFYSQRLFCSRTPTGGYLPVTENGQIGGNYNYGYGTEETCKIALEAAKNNLVCTWNGRTIVVYRISDTMPIIGDEYFRGGYSELEDCNTAVQNSSRNVVCLWNGRTDGGYSPYRISDGQALTRTENISADGRGEYGFNNEEDCYESIRRSENNTICSWSANRRIGYQLISIRTGNVISSFGSLDECLESSSD